LASAGDSFVGENETDFTGSSVAGLGDFNGDGFDDFAIGEGQPVSWGGYGGSRSAYLVYGGEADFGQDAPLSTSFASFVGENETPFTNCVVAGAGDIDNDGFSDLLIGTPEDSTTGYRSGKTYLIFGNETSFSNGTGLQGGFASFLGEWSEDYSGASLAPAGDVNGDDYDDFLIGAPGVDFGNYMNGKA
jgi:hypothetical protein